MTGGLVVGIVIVLFTPVGWLVIVGCVAGAYALAELIDRRVGFTQRECDAVDPWKKPSVPEDER